MKLREVHIRWMGIPVVGLIAEQGSPDHMPELSFFVSYLIAICFTAVYWNGACFVIFHYRKKFPEISRTGRRLMLTALGIIIWMSIGGIPLKLLFGVTEVENLLQMSEHTEFLPFNFVAAMVIATSYEAFYFFDKYKETFRQNEELKNQQISTQYEVLQNQMSPHFLFNSLNTLTTVIAEDPKLAIEFTEKLSEVYRYILQNKERELVTLEEELDFVKSYLFLLRMRYPENLSFDFNVEEKYHSLTIPPLTLQMLVENAIKHNVVSKAKPLHIDVYIENGRSVLVKNNLQPREVLEKSTKTGLENIRKRYSILGGREISIFNHAGMFAVSVPLIDVVHES